MMSEFTDESTSTLSRRVILLPALTVEVALYGALTFIALFLRLLALGDAPLALDEARQAVAAWHWTQGTPDAFTGSPLLFTANAILFGLFGATDGVARLLPAFCGAGLVLLPALLRRELGRVGALIASLLCAFSPSLIFFSRNSDGAILAVTLGAAALAFAWRYLDERATRFAYLTAIFSALAFLSAREVWTIALVTGLFVLMIRFHWLPLDQPISNDDRSHSNDLRNAAILFGITLLGVGTMFGLYREGIGAAFDLLSAWLQGLVPAFEFSDPLRVLVVYDPIPLFFGVVALVQLGFVAQASRREHIPLLFAAVWILLAFIAYSLGADKNPARVIVLVVPLVLLAGWYIGAWLEQAAFQTDRESVWGGEAPVYFLALAIAVFLFFVVAEFTTRGGVIAAQVLSNWIGANRAGANWDGILIVGLMVIAFAAMAFLAVTTVGWVRAKNVGLAIVLTLIGLWTIRQSAMLNYSAAWNPYDYLVARASAPNVCDLVRDLKDVSRWRANDTYTLTVIADESLGPIVAWNLREFRNAQFSARPTVTLDSHALLLPASAPAPATGWMSQTYHVQMARNVDIPTNFLRWFVFRDVGALQYVDATLWMPQPQ